MKIQWGELSIRVAEKILYGLLAGAVSWALWVSVNISRLGEDILIIKQIVLSQRDTSINYGNGQRGHEGGQMVAGRQHTDAHF